MKSRYSKVDICKILSKGFKTRGVKINWISFYAMQQDEMSQFVKFCQELDTWDWPHPQTFKFDNELLGNWRKQILKPGKFKLVEA